MDRGLATLPPVPPGSHGYYCDLPCAVRVCGANLLWDGERSVGCISERALVVGAWVVLRNVRVRRGPCVEVTPRSSVVVFSTSLEAPALEPPALAPPAPDAPEKRPWRCPECHYLYHHWSASCYRCHEPRPSLRKRLREPAVLMMPTARPSKKQPVVESPAPPLMAVSNVTEVLHVSSDVQVTRLRDVISTLQPPNAKFLVEASVVDMLPAESRHWTRCFCALCSQPTDAASVGANAWSGATWCSCAFVMAQ